MHPFLEADLQGIVSDAGVPVSCDGGTFNGVFRDQYEAMETGMIVEGLKPTIVATAADIERVGLAKEARIVCEGVIYKVRRLEPMVAGMTRIVLRAA